MIQRRVGIYPGTFDPITNGHTDIIRRAARIVDRLVIGVARNDGKGPLFATDERVDFVRDEVADLDNGDAERIEVRAFDTLLMGFAHSVGAKVNYPRPARGLRFRIRIPDGRHERPAQPGDRDRLLGWPRTAFSSSRSRFVKEIGALGGDVSHFVSPRVGGAPARPFRVRPPQSRRRAAAAAD